MIKLLAVDLDGTLLYPKKYISLISRQNKKFLQEFASSGGIICCVTGRNPRFKKKIEKKIKNKVYYIGCNGAFNIDKEDNIIAEHTLDNKIAEDIFNDLNKDETIMGYFLINMEDAIICYSKISRFISFCIRIIARLRLSFSEIMVSNRKTFFKHLKSEKIHKLSPIYGMNKKFNQQVYENLKIFKAKYGDKVNIENSNSVLEITAANRNKLNALDELINLLGISRDEVAYIGDSGNDICVFDNYPHTFCMSHTDKGIKEHAKYVVDHVSDIQFYLEDINKA